MAQKPKLRSTYNHPGAHAVIAVLAFGLSYVTASWAIDTGRLLVYFATLVLLVIGVRQAAQVIIKVHAK